MEKEMRSDRSYTGMLAFSFVMSLLFVSASAVLGEILMPFASAFFAVLLFVENKNHIFSLICVFAAVALTVIMFNPISIWSTVAVIVGFAIYFMYKFKNSKCDTSILLIIIVSLAIALSFVLTAVAFTGEYTFESVIDFYKGLYAEIKVEFVKKTKDIYEKLAESSGVVISEDTVIYALDAFVKTIPSVIMTISFFMIGISLKVYTSVLKRFTETTDRIHTWSFSIPSVYGYFYLILYILAIFLTDSGMISLAVANLTGILSFMFAYMGLKFAYNKICKRAKKVLAIALLILGIMLLGTLAVNLLSIFGVFCTISDSKRGGMSDNNINL